MNAPFANDRNPYYLFILAIICLVGMRMSIGWYFFNGAREKNLNREFTSATFLSGAQGFLADWFKAGLPDFHGWSRLMALPLEDKPNPHDATAKPAEWRQFERRVYADWYQQIVDDWGRYKEKVANHFSYEAEQEDKAAKLFAYYTGRLNDHFTGAHQDLAAYRHELYRLENMSASHSADDTPFEQQRIGAMRAATSAQALQIQAAVEDIEREYQDELQAVATDDQRNRSGHVPIEKSALEKFDWFLKYTHFAIGGCLLVGLLTRLAAFGAGAFVLMVILSRPPWDVGYQLVGYQIVMMFGCFLLMAVGAGRWAGLDYFLCPALLKCCSSSRQGDA